MSYAKSAEIYDTLYAFKDYEQECQEIRRLLEANGIAAGARLLDVGCGTGKHLSLLSGDYAVAGVDLSPEMLASARVAVPSCEFVEADMRSFRFSERFDAILCLFSSIGYMPDATALGEAIQNMANHLAPHGVLFVEQWLDPTVYRAGHLDLTTADRPDIKVARVTCSSIDGNVSVFDMHHLVATPHGVEYFIEPHRLTMFTESEYLEAFGRAGLNATRRDDVLTKRGLFVAQFASISA